MPHTLTADEVEHIHWHDGYEVYRRARGNRKEAHRPLCPRRTSTGQPCKNYVSYRQQTCYRHRHVAPVPFLQAETLQQAIWQRYPGLTADQCAFLATLYTTVHTFDPWHQEETGGLVDMLQRVWHEEAFRRVVFRLPEDDTLT